MNEKIPKRWRLVGWKLVTLSIGITILLQLIFSLAFDSLEKLVQIFGWATGRIISSAFIISSFWHTDRKWKTAGVAIAIVFIVFTLILRINDGWEPLPLIEIEQHIY